MAAFSHQSFLLHNQTVYFPNPTTTTNAACFPDHTFHGYYEDQAASVANKLQSPDSSMSMVLDDQKLESGNIELLAKKRKEKQVSINFT